MRGSSAEGWKSWLNRGNTATSRLPASMLLSLLLLLLSSCVLLPAISYNSKPKRIYPSARSQTYSPSCFGTTFHLRRGETKNLSHEQADLTPAYERARVRPVLAPQATTQGRTEFPAKRSDGTRQTSHWHAAVRTPSLPWPRLPTHPAALCFWKKYPSMTSGPGLRLVGDATCPG